MAEKPIPSLFDPDSSAYDDASAQRGGLVRNKTPGENFGHLGSVTDAPPIDKEILGLPDESYLVLKGRAHESWDKAEQAETARGFKIVRRGNRDYSVPNDWKE